MKKVGIFFLVLLICAAGVLYFFRYEIFQISAESIIKKHLPPFMFVDSLDFDLKNGVLTVKGLGIRNPRGYKSRYLATVDTLTCSYKMKGDKLLDGIKVTDIQAAGIVIDIERRYNGKLNVNEMKDVMDTGKSRGALPAAGGAKNDPRSFNIANFVELTDTIEIKDGRVDILDEDVIRSGEYRLSIEDIQAEIMLRLNDDYTNVLAVGSSGSGNLNGDRMQKINWNISLDPGSPALTMSNRIQVSDLNIMLFKPYYDKYSPVDINSGRFSGTIVMDFDNGDIGSMNTLTLYDLSFSRKDSLTGAAFWDAALPDMIQYLQSSPGKITFDFKIKGSMSNPRFYPGPVVKDAMKRMAVDKISQLLQPSEEGEEASSGGGSDTDKVINALKGLLSQ